MLSALFDGQAGAENVLANLPVAAGHNMHSDWNCYQLIGDSLRSSSTASRLGADPVFLQHIRARLTQEVIDKPATTAVAVPSTTAANDHQFRWKLVAGFASLSAVAAVAWSLSGAFLGASAPQLAQGQAGPTLVAASPEGPMIRDPRLEELLSAHKQLGGTSLQVPSGFVRNAGFESPRQSGR